MKKPMLVFIMILLSGNVYAQEKDLKDLYKDVTTAINSVLLTKQGVIETSGFLSYNHVSTEYENNQESTYSTWHIEPQISYFVMDNFALGLLLSHASERIEFDSQSTDITMEQTLLGPITKMYFGEEKWRPFVFADYLFMFGDSEGGEMDFGAGIFYHVSGNFGVNFFGNYGIIWSEESSIKSQNRLFVGIGISSFIL